MRFPRFSIPALAAVATVAFATPGAVVVNDLSYEAQAEQSRLAAVNQLNSVRARLEGTIAGNLLLAVGLVADIAISGGITPAKFDAMAATLVGHDDLVRSLTIAPNGRVARAYPVSGNDSMVGLNLLDDPARGAGARAAVRNREAVVEGPVALPQGGFGLIGRIPVVVASGDVWGLVNITIDAERLFARAGLIGLGGDLRVGLRMLDQDGVPFAVIYGDAATFSPGAVTVDVHLPTGLWQLAAVAEGGWGSAGRHTFVKVASGAVVVMLGMIAFVIGAFIETSRRYTGTVRASEARLLAATRASGDGFCLLDRNDSVVTCNEGFASVFQVPPERLIGTRFEDIMREAHDRGAGFMTQGETFDVWIETLSSRRAEAGNMTTTFQARDGRWFELRERTAETGERVLIRFDVTEQKILEEELRRLATSDPLTGAANRRHYLQRAQAEWDRFRRYNRPLSLMMIDIDYFKKINDGYGHPVGDQALKRLVETAGQSLRNNDLLGRFGGEEFAILLPETDIEPAAALAERLRHRLSRIEVPTERGPLSFTVSIGVATCELGDANIERTLKRADDALYRAKQGGRNRVERAEPALDPQDAALAKAQDA
ncbi:MAG: diguanylate cyclase [Alphaproteobacteria bacterium]|nr:diguanylate cyclase [Alphaproteobacteria bacterium]